MALSKSGYARALRAPGVRSVLLIGVAVRVPLGAASVVIVLHVVDDLQRTYAMAGLVATTLGIMTAIGSPRRGRLLGRVGVRRTVAPSIVVLAFAGVSIAWVGYWPLLALAALSGMFALPTLAVVRASLDSAVDDELRPTTMALDAIAADAAFMLGPAGGIAVATWFSDQVALSVCVLAYAVGGMLMWWRTPSLGSAERHQDESGGLRSRSMLGSSGLAFIVAVAFACAAADSAGELSTVAAMRGWHQQQFIGLVISSWALGSILGGIVFGALPRRPGSTLLLAGLAGSLALTAVADNPWTYALLLALNGLFVAPTYAAISSEVTARVPSGKRAEALGWQAGATVLGAALGTPATGWVIDKWGWQAGLLVATTIGLLALLPRAALGLGHALRRAQLTPDAIPESDWVAVRRVPKASRHGTPSPR